MNILAQIIGLFAMGINIISYQFKKSRHVMLCQLIGSALFAVNMLMLGAVMGGILNAVGIFRAYAYILANERNWNRKYLNWGFILVYLLSYGFSFAVIGTEPTTANLLTEILPLIGMTSMTIGFSSGNAKTIRICGFINSPCWLTYNCINFSIGGILCEVISLVSAFTAFLRLDAKNKKTHS